MSLFSRKKKVTCEQMGDILAEYTRIGMSDFLQSFQGVTDRGNMDERLKLRMELEVLIFRMFTVGSICMTFIRPKDKIDKILESYHKVVYNEMIQSGMCIENLESFKQLLLKRGFEYSVAWQTKEGPNPLWPLAKAVIRNILGEEMLEDSVLNLTVACLYSSCAVAVKGLIKDYKIVNDK
jgi:hypothetical protein